LYRILPALFYIFIEKILWFKKHSAKLAASFQAILFNNQNMKKSVLTAFAIMGFSFYGAMAQSSVTFKVNADDFINNGGVMVNGVVSIAGAFSDRGGDLSNWSPPAGAMADLGNNVFSKTVNFSGATIATDSLQWKYVQGSDWADGDEGNEWNPVDASCARPSDNNNRKVLLPTAGTWEYSSLWAQCGTLTQLSSSMKLVSGLVVEMGPNPTSGSLNVRFAGSANSEIKMTDVNGRMVKSFKTAVAGDNTTSVDVSDLKGGIYYVTVIDGNKGFQAPVVIVK
jgi:hypothetical protein